MTLDPGRTRSRRPGPALTAALLGVALPTVTGCVDDGVGPGGGAPAVVATIPAAHASAAPPGATLAITVDRPLDPASLDAGDLRVTARGTGAVAGDLTLADDGRTLRFAPAVPFAHGAEVTATLRAGAVADAGGRPLEEGWTWTFRVATRPGALLPRRVGARSLRRPGEAWIQTYGAWAGDLDGDGVGDLVFPNERSVDLRILLGDGAGGYGPARVVAVPGGARPSPSDGVDLDGDGALDLVVGNTGNGVLSVFRGGGDGTLVPWASHPLGGAVRGLCVVDLENDGDPDVVATDAGEGGGVHVLVNDGTGALVPGPVVDLGSPPWACAVADLDRDGLLDVAVGLRLGREVVGLLSRGDGTLALGPRRPVGADPWSMAAGDMDGDGDADLVTVGAADGRVLLVPGDGEGGLDAPRVVPLDGFPLAVDLGDLDGDGDLDVVASAFATALFTVFANDGAGGLVEAGTLPAPSAASCAVLHDRDGDGDLDVTGIDELDDLVLFFENP